LQSAFLSGIHSNTSLLSTISIYYQGLTCQYLWYILLVVSNGRYRWEILTRNNQANFKLQPIGVVADMNGFPVIKVNALEFARNAKAQIGISLSKTELKCSDASRCNRRLLVYLDATEPTQYHVSYLGNYMLGVPMEVSDGRTC
jgi:hypothetical protein